MIFGATFSRTSCAAPSGSEINEKLFMLHACLRFAQTSCSRSYAA